jgi:hypothetical protein
MKQIVLLLYEIAISQDSIIYHTPEDALET